MMKLVLASACLPLNIGAREIEASEVRAGDRDACGLAYVYAHGAGIDSTERACEGAIDAKVERKREAIAPPVVMTLAEKRMVKIL